MKQIIHLKKILLLSLKPYPHNGFRYVLYTFYESSHLTIFSGIQSKSFKTLQKFSCEFLINQKKIAIPPRPGSVRHFELYVRF